MHCSREAKDAYISDYLIVFQAGITLYSSI